MADRQDIEKVVRDAYAARAAKDLDAIARLVMPSSRLPSLRAAVHKLGRMTAPAGMRPLVR